MVSVSAGGLPFGPEFPAILHWCAARWGAYGGRLHYVDPAHPDQTLDGGAPLVSDTGEVSSVAWLKRQEAVSDGS